MADERKGVAIAADVLATVLSKLDEVMAEAERLRRQVSRQLAEQRASQQQKLNPASRKKPSRKR